MKIFSKTIVLIAFISITFSACKKDTVETPKVVTEAKTTLNVKYGASALQNMDIYLPANRTSNTGLVIFAHGGSFIGGDKDDYTTLVKELVRNDFAVININYRLVDATGLYDSPVRHMQSAVKIKDQVSDVSLAIDYAIAHAKEWQVSESKIALAGHSAGATLALLYSYDARNTNKVKVVANLAGALDLTFPDVPDFLLQFLPDNILEGGYRYTGYEVKQDNLRFYKEISPLYANIAQKVPTLTLFPENNSVGDLPNQGKATFEAFTTKLNSLSVPNKFVQIAGADHEFTGKFDLVLKEVVTYFNANLK